MGGSAKGGEEMDRDLLEANFRPGITGTLRVSPSSDRGQRQTPIELYKTSRSHPMPMLANSIHRIPVFVGWLHGRVSVE